jgi:flavin-dependent dehydrogenase
LSFGVLKYGITDVTAMNYDVIIVGAGIAGISSAIHLRKQDEKLKILVIEKTKFPRTKLCAGYLTNKSTVLLKELGLDIKTIHYKLIKGLTVFYKYKKRFSLNNHGLYCQELVDRSVLDNELFKLLCKNDIDVIENASINNLDLDNNQITVNNDTFRYINLIFADGELGYSAKFNTNNKRYFAMQANLKKESQAQIHMYFNITKRGYAWYSSSGSYINIGFCDIYNSKINYNELFSEFVNNLGIKENVEVKGFFVPYGLKKNRIINKNIYLIGDAVGMVDPLTLAGISYAILSGKVVSKSILAKDNNIYLSYLKKVKVKYSILKVFHKVLYNEVFLFAFIRVAGRLFGNLFVYILDRFILNRNFNFHE